MVQGTGQVGLAAAAGSGHQEILATVNPVTLRQARAICAGLRLRIPVKAPLRILLKEKSSGVSSDYCSRDFRIGAQ